MSYAGRLSPNEEPSFAALEYRERDMHSIHPSEEILVQRQRYMLHANPALCTGLHLIMSEQLSFPRLLWFREASRHTLKGPNSSGVNPLGFLVCLYVGPSGRKSVSLFLCLLVCLLACMFAYLLVCLFAGVFA